MVQEYLKNPCQISSLPFWKTITVEIPNNMEVINDIFFTPDKYSNYNDNKYFKLIHNLKNIKSSVLPVGYHFRTVDIKKDLQTVVDIINNSYHDISVSLDYLKKCIEQNVFDNSLWIFIVDETNSSPIGLGIADFDISIKEGILEWIQLLPSYRGKGLGQSIVNKLLELLADKADFVIVSGQVDNVTNPEKLYRKCSFIGNDIWHVLRTK